MRYSYSQVAFYFMDDFLLFLLSFRVQLTSKDAIFVLGVKQPSRRGMVCRFFTVWEIFSYGRKMRPDTHMEGC